MLKRQASVTYTSIFCIAVFVLLVSRILVLTNNYDWLIDPVMLEICYLFFVVFLVIANNNGKFTAHSGAYWAVLGLVLLHTVLWGKVFVDARLVELINKRYRSQIMFVIILFVTVWAAIELHAQKAFLICGYYALATVLFAQLVTNFDQIDLTNLANIFTAEDRTRANFGFGHYNALGSACVCVIVLRQAIKAQRKQLYQKVIDGLVLIMAMVMLLCCASRSAITGLLLFFALYHLFNINQWNLRPSEIRAIKVLGVFALILLTIWAFFDFEFGSFLEVAQRALLFTHTIPMFLKSGKVLLGLGYVETDDYANGMTPYKTFWLDNAYAYYLVATGVIGLAILVIVIIIIGKNLTKHKDTRRGRIVLAAFGVYLYISLFEAQVFNSGVLINYIYIPWFLFCATNGERAVVSYEQ